MKTKKIFEAIYDYLRSNGIQQSFVSDKIGVKRQSFSMSMRGQRRISVDEYEKICNVLGVNYDYFYKKSKGE